MVCGVWCVVCDVWCVVCIEWNLVRCSVCCMSVYRLLVMSPTGWGCAHDTPFGRGCGPRGVQLGSRDGNTALVLIQLVATAAAHHHSEPAAQLEN